MPESGSEKSVLEKRMAKDVFFSTPVYHTDLADAGTLNARLKQDIRAWLVHAVHPNLSTEEGEDGERISVSFNFYQLRRGSDLRNPNRKEVVAGDLDSQS